MDRNKVEEFMISKIAGGWLFISMVKLHNALGWFPKEELNEMAKEGLVKKRPGVNGVLVEVTEKGLGYLKNLKKSSFSAK